MLDICGPIFFKPGIVTDVPEVCTLKSSWMTLAFIQSHNFVREQKVLCSISHRFVCWVGWNVVCCSQAVGFIKLNLIFLTTGIQGSVYVIYHWHWPVFRHFRTKFVIWLMLDKTKCYILITVWMTMTITQGHGVTRKLVLAQSLFCIVAWRNPNFCDGWLCKGDDCIRSCKYG